MQNACSTLPARVHCKGAPPSSEKQQRQNLARDAAPIGSNDARPPERDALPDVLQHLLGDLGDERPDERDPVAHHRAAGRVAGVAAVTSQGSVLQGVQMKNGSRRYVLHMSPSDFKVALHESVFRVSLSVQSQWRSVRRMSPCSGPTPFFHRGCLLTFFGRSFLT